jgi:hypothetical protein
MVAKTNGLTRHNYCDGPCNFSVNCPWVRVVWARKFTGEENKAPISRQRSRIGDAIV